MADLLRRFGHHLSAARHDDIMSIIVRQLETDKAIVRKKAAMCLGSLALVSTDLLLNRLVESILSKIETGRHKGTSSCDIRTLIQTIGTISRTVGYRLGRFLDCLVPLFLEFCGDAEDENQQTDTANELREHSFPGLESFVLRCTLYLSLISLD